jgi:hypothetical protein
MEETLVLKQSIHECGESGIVQKFVYKNMGKKGAKTLFISVVVFMFWKATRRSSRHHFVTTSWPKDSWSWTASVSRYEALFCKTDLVSRKECLKSPKCLNHLSHFFMFVLTKIKSKRS